MKILNQIGGRNYKKVKRYLLYLFIYQYLMNVIKILP